MDIDKLIEAAKAELKKGKTAEQNKRTLIAAGIFDKSGKYDQKIFPKEAFEKALKPSNV